MTSIALLRGINVGKAKRVAMADLRTLLTEIGYTDVRTLLNSGNIVFGVPAKLKGDHATRIEKALETTLGVRSRVLVIDAATLETIVDENSLVALASDHAKLLVTIFAKAIDAKRLADLVEESWAPEAVALGSRALYLWCPAGVLASRANLAASKILGESATSRNWATILKLRAMCAA